MLFYATDAGTLSAKRHMSGVSMGCSARRVAVLWRPGKTAAWCF